MIAGEWGTAAGVLEVQHGSDWNEGRASGPNEHEPRVERVSPNAADDRGGLNESGFRTVEIDWNEPATLPELESGSGFAGTREVAESADCLDICDEMNRRAVQSGYRGPGLICTDVCNDSTTVIIFGSSDTSPGRSVLEQLSSDELDFVASDFAGLEME